MALRKIPEGAVMSTAPVVLMMPEDVVVTAPPAFKVNPKVPEMPALISILLAAVSVRRFPAEEAMAALTVILPASLPGSAPVPVGPVFISTSERDKAETRLETLIEEGDVVATNDEPLTVSDPGSSIVTL